VYVQYLMTVMNCGVTKHMSENYYVNFCDNWKL